MKCLYKLRLRWRLIKLRRARKRLIESDKFFLKAELLDLLNACIACTEELIGYENTNT